ncbi:hypothetical protein AC579_3624 [Pseudocercospora musae]|uniref:Uncharacterized protein n=1 Tax=Pseudocercospora musae TaxID=113226 RepID=A0A139IT13_9PEZI|nr:hypothetical protein AC579_3624 [Pseudocercospora musae]
MVPFCRMSLSFQDFVVASELGLLSYIAGLSSLSLATGKNQDGLTQPPLIQPRRIMLFPSRFDPDLITTLLTSWISNMAISTKRTCTSKRAYFSDLWTLVEDHVTAQFASLQLTSAQMGQYLAGETETGRRDRFLNFNRNQPYHLDINSLNLPWFWNVSNAPSSTTIL